MKLEVVFHLIDEVKGELHHLLSHIDVDEFVLLLPKSFERMQLDRSCFYRKDLNSLGAGLLLSSLNGIGTDDRKPLILEHIRR